MTTDNELEYIPSHLSSSNLRPSLSRRAQLRTFLSFTDRTASFIAFAIRLVFVVLLVAYFTAHILLYLTGAYDHQTTIVPTANASHYVATATLSK